MSEEMRSLIGRREGVVGGILRKLRLLRADCIFFCFLHFMQKKRRFRVAKMQSVEPQHFSRHSFPAKQKAIPYGMAFCFGGDKRDRTADLMTAS